MSELTRALEQLPPALQDEVAGYWQSYCAAARESGVAPPTESTLLKQLVRVWAGSGFIARTCIREPRLPGQLHHGGELSGQAADCATRLAAALETVKDEEALAIALRRFRRREMVRIGWRDLAGLAALPDTLAALSDLADAVLEAALQRLYRWQAEKLGVPRDEQGRAQPLVILGMGKLGGRELNYSSDIDLIFTFPQAGRTDGSRPVDNEEFFRRLGQRLIKMLSEATAEGLVFRVDLRLRPFGESGPLVMPFNACEEYYQNHGRDWERYALIKARVVAGDRAAGEDLLARLRPFVYRRYLDYGAIESLRDMKMLIVKEVERKGLQRNIKLGPGGIREIEFIGQVFQLIYGGREPALRSRGILKVLDELAQTGRLPGDVAAALKDAYEFLRRTENRLQMWADQQTHNLPDEATARLRLAYAMGFADWDGFSAALARHTGRVSRQFEQIFAGSRTAELDFTALWQGAVDEESALRFLQERGFAAPSRTWRHLQGFQQSYGYRSLSRRGRERMDALLPLLLAEVAGSGAAPSETLERIVQLLEAVGQRSAYLALLMEQPPVRAQLIKLCAASPWISQYLARYPLLLDELLDPATLYHPPRRSDLGEDLERYLERVPEGDSEQLLDALRHFKQINILRVAAADINGAMPLMIVSDYLTEIAEVLLRKVLALAWAELAARHGRPLWRGADGAIREAGFAIVGYGKLGGIEMNYGSDLDLVFLHDSGGGRQTEGPRQIDHPTFFARLVQRIIHWLTTRTGAGELYPVDTRLRPSGRAGLLVSDIDAFAEYQSHQAWTWEHQALVRARVVAGSKALAERFAAVRRAVLSRPRDRAGLRREVRQMRERMRQELGSRRPGRFHLKQDPGGIADIEFMVQYAVLANAQRYPELLTYTDNIRQLNALERAGVVNAKDADGLREAYRALRRRLHWQTLQERPEVIEDEELRGPRDTVARLWRALLEDG